MTLVDEENYEQKGIATLEELMLQVRLKDISHYTDKIVMPTPREGKKYNLPLGL